MKDIAKILAILAASIYAQQAAALAGCVTSHQECEYQCIEYYPNGTDCKKSKKVCHEVCDDFDVKPSGDTPHVPITTPPKSQGTPNSSQTPSKSQKEIDINTGDLTPPTQNCVSADGKVFKCN